MSLYNMVNGTYPIAGDLLAMLGFDTAEKRSEIPRLRDCFLNDGKIVVLTRTGGGNRESYTDENEKMRQVAGFIKDEDDSFDVTFNWFWYEVPVKYKDVIADVYKEVGDHDPMGGFKAMAKGRK